MLEIYFAAAAGAERCRAAPSAVLAGHGGAPDVAGVCRPMASSAAAAPQTRGRKHLVSARPASANEAPPQNAPDYESSTSMSSRVSARIRLLSAVMIASARSRFVCCSAKTFSSTVSREMRR